MKLLWKYCILSVMCQIYWHYWESHRRPVLTIIQIVYLLFQHGDQLIHGNEPSTVKQDDIKEQRINIARELLEHSNEQQREDKWDMV